MAIKSFRITFIVRVIVYLYVIALCFWWFMDNYGGGYINWIMVLLIVFSLSALFIHKKLADIVIGWIITAGSFYMILAVLSASSRAIAKNHHDAAMNVLKYGLPIFSLSLASGVVLLLLSYLGITTKK